MRREIQNGRVIIESEVLITTEWAINCLFSLYLSARANGVIASGIADSRIEIEKSAGFRFKRIRDR